MTNTTECTAETTEAARHAETYRLGRLAGLDDHTLRVILDAPAGGTRMVAPKALGSLTTEEWQIVRSVLKPAVRSAKGIPPRQFIDACAHKLRHRVSGWSQLPPDFGPPNILRQRFDRWAEAGIWQELAAALRCSALSASRIVEFDGLATLAAEGAVRRAEYRGGPVRNNN